MLLILQLGMSSHENATPIRVLHNSAGHLNGPARSLGGVVVGYLGVRVFTPKPVTKMVENVGGCSVLLGRYWFVYTFVDSYLLMYLCLSAISSVRQTRVSPTILFFLSTLPFTTCFAFSQFY